MAKMDFYAEVMSARQSCPLGNVSNYGIMVRLETCFTADLGGKHLINLIRRCQLVWQLI